VVDAEQLQEVIWAILRNALEVSQAGQRVAISGKVDAESLTIEICDQGPGMSPEAIQHCFDLFYSGREAGRGMGLGLAKARRLVDLAGGRLTADNRPGGGCRFSLSLPVG
jgi:signal transduction histidine kinase